MLHTWRLGADIKIDTDDLRRVLRGMIQAGWEPAITLSEQRFSDLAGINPDLPVRSQLSIMYSPFRGAGEFVGDVFFRDKDVYYVISTPEEHRRSWVIHFHEGDDTSSIDDSMRNLNLEVGLISNRQEDLDGRLLNFAKDFQGQVLNTLDGRKTRYMNFDWAPPIPKKNRLSTIIDDGERSQNLKFMRAELNACDVAAAKFLEDSRNRKLLIELNQAVFAREVDVLSRRPKNKEDIKTAITGLVESGLLVREYLLECRASSRPITRLSDPSKLKSKEISGLICPSCGRAFSDEALSESYSASELGRKMIQGNHWLTVWLTDLLSDLGVPAENIIWNASESGEEIDLIAEFLSEFWIFELKDREFGAGDAHPFNYRVVRFQADRAVILTTEKVSKDAKRVFDDLREQAGDTQSVVPIFIEGLSEARRVLTAETVSASTRYACQRVRPLEFASGLDVSGAVVSRFGEPRPDLDEEEY